MHPSSRQGKRNTPIRGIILTGAELDQTLGILLLREFQPLTIYATAAVRRTLEANSFFRMLTRIPNQLTWVEICPGHPFTLDGKILCTPISMPGALPSYAHDREAPGSGEAGLANIGLVLETESTKIAYTPSLPGITAELRDIYSACDVIFVDGTFWSDDELSRTQPGTPLARSIGHVPIGDRDGTIALLADITRPRKVFVHINNTNPVLDQNSDEYKQASETGWEIGYDGWELK